MHVTIHLLKEGLFVAMEPYLIFLPKPLQNYTVRFRLSNHRLPVEILRYDGINKTQRICQKCSKGDIGDECHYNTVPSILNNKEMRFERCIHLFM